MLTTKASGFFIPLQQRKNLTMLHKLSLTNFKNYNTLEVEFSPKINCITGDNGEGKTNILDAIYYLSFCKSFFSSTDALTVKHNENFFIIQGEYEINGEPELIYCGFESGKRKRFKRNKKEYDRMSDHIGLLPLVMASPHDTSLIIGGSDERRKFIDGIICQFDHDYLYHYQSYQRVLAQRNHMLREASNYSPVDNDMLQIYDEQLAYSGTVIYEKRKSFIASFEPFFQKYFSTISQDKEQVALNYISSLDNADLLQTLTANHAIDIATRYTNFGVHKDDLELKMGEQLIRKTGSQGQQKTYLIALKLAQFEYIRQQCQTMPILLLDDIFDKLDDKRVSQIVRIVAQNNFGQIFITDTSRDRINNILQQIEQPHCHFHLSNGILTTIE